MMALGFALFCLLPDRYGLSGGNDFIYPAEWEPHQALWMGFRTRDEGLLHEELLQQILPVLTRHVHVNLVVEDKALFDEKDVYLSMLGIPTSCVTVQALKPADFWFRDSGPLFLINSNGRKAVADFRFNNYQNISQDFEPEKIRQMSQVDQNIARQRKLPLFSSDLVLEGGAFDVNGKGTILLSGLVLERNPGWKKQDVEKEILSLLGQKKAVWLDQGLAQDPLGFKRITGNFWGRGTGGHLDEFARFVNGSTILLAWVPEEEKDRHPVNRINYQRMHKNYQILMQSKDQDDNPFTVIKVPLPDIETKTTISSSGESLSFVPAASYLNFMITNGLVIIPGYWLPGKPESIKHKDEVMKSTMKTFFPAREIVQISPQSLNLYGGGLHCIYRQEPQ